MGRPIESVLIFNDSGEESDFLEPRMHIMVNLRKEKFSLHLILVRVVL